MLIENAKFISTKIIYLSNFKTKKLEIAFFKTFTPTPRKNPDSEPNNKRTLRDELINENKKSTTAYDYISYCGSVPDHLTTFLIVSKRSCGPLCHIFQLSSQRMAKKFKNKVCAFIEQAFNEFKLKTYHNYPFSYMY